MRTQTIRFNFKGKTHTFSRPIATPVSGTADFIKDCYAKVGAKPKQVTRREMTHTGWNFWCGFDI